MMRQAIYTLLLASHAAPALADMPMTGAQFERYTLGRTYTYARTGAEPYGIELYRPNRQVVWAVFGDDCTEGYWYDTDDSQICFVYPDDVDHKCWYFFKEGDRLRGDFVEEGNDAEYSVQVTTDPVPCFGPLVGV